MSKEKRKAGNFLPRVFNYTDKPVRIVNKNNEMWFVAKDICDILKLGRPFDRLRNLDDDEKGAFSTRTPGGNQRLLAVNESGLYNLIFKSRNSEAKKFRKWVTSEILPTLRVKGKYEIDQALALPEPGALIAMPDKIKGVESITINGDEMLPFYAFMKSIGICTAKLRAVNAYPGQFARINGRLYISRRLASIKFLDMQLTRAKRELKGQRVFGKAVTQNQTQTTRRAIV